MNSIITTALNLQKEEFQPFFDTIKNTSVDKIFVYTNILEEDDYPDLDIKIIKTDPGYKNLMFFIWECYFECLNKCSEHFHYTNDKIIFCDSRDIIFTKDIFDCNDIDWKEKLTTTSESQLTIENENWTKDHFIDYYGWEQYAKHKNKYALNSGITFGNVFNLYSLCRFMLREKNHEKTSNQATYNYILHNWEILDISHHHALNYGTFRLKYPNIDILEYGEPFYILHQYDRAPEKSLKNIENKYNISINSSLWRKNEGNNSNSEVDKKKSTKTKSKRI